MATAVRKIYAPIGQNQAAIDDEMQYEEVCGSKQSPISFTVENIQLTNYPNPFNDNTTITFTLADKANTTLKVYDTYGKEVATLFDAMAEPGQEYTLNFSSSNLPAGIYLCRLRSGDDVSVVRKMVLRK